MRMLRGSRSPWVLAAALLLACGVGRAARAPDAPRSTHIAASRSASAAGNPTHLSHGRFRDFLVYQPSGTPVSFALLLSGDDGWTPLMDGIARQLMQRGAMVAGIDWPKFKASLEADADRCVFPDGDLENLSHFVQAYTHTPTYLPPMLSGYGAGASMAYAVLAQAPRNTFAAALTLNFCPSLAMEKPLCKGAGLDFVESGRGVDFLPIKALGNPWVALQGAADRSCPIEAAGGFIAKVHGAALVALPNVGHEFVSAADWLPQYTAAYAALTTQNSTARVAPPPSSLSDLPVIEIPAKVVAQSAPALPALPATGSTSAAPIAPATPDRTALPAAPVTPAAVTTAPSALTSPPAAPDFFAIFMSGDGGWAGLDQDVAAALAAQGIPVVGLDSLRYYWTARSPQGLAADTDRIIRYYLAHFAKQRVLLIGYSQGADVLPFAVNRLPEATRATVALAAVMGMSEHALFEFHLANWLSDDNSGPATLPEINRLSGFPVLCIYGEDEKDSLCPKLDPQKFKVVKLKGGHHFDGDYAGLARQIISAAKP